MLITWVSEELCDKWTCYDVIECLLACANFESALGSAFMVVARSCVGCFTARLSLCCWWWISASLSVSFIGYMKLIGTTLILSQLLPSLINLWQLLQCRHPHGHETMVQAIGPTGEYARQGILDKDHRLTT